MDKVTQADAQRIKALKEIFARADKAKLFADFDGTACDLLKKIRKEP